MSIQKQQHYIPKCYSRNFANSEGYIFVRDTWTGKGFHSKPSNALRQNYLYTQPVHAENRFDNALESFFSNAVESGWPSIVAAIIRKEDLTGDQWQQLIEFMLSIRVRVPNTLKAVTAVLKERVQQESQKIPADGLLLDLFMKRRPEFRGTPSIGDLINEGIISTTIDPHRPLLSMEKLIRSNRAILSIRGQPKFLHNRTSENFISSDNPFVSHIYKRKIEEITPYSYDRLENIEIVFPISSNTALMINTRKKDNKQHYDVTDKDTIRSINEKISLYADRYVFCADAKNLETVKGYSEKCPVPVRNSAIMDADGIVHDIRFQFGRPLDQANNWKYDFE